MIDQIYPPSEDSELLLEAALQEVRMEDDVLEVGIGSGFVSSQLLDICRSLVGTDISPLAVKAAKKKGVEVLRTQFARGIGKSFSLILFNPPYLELDEREKVEKSDKGEKGVSEDWMRKAIDGGKNGTETISRFLSEIKDVLAPEGRIILIVSSINFPYIEQEIKNHEFSYQTLLKKRVFFEELYALKLYPN
ncbi:MAG: HemK2/MTQ2 family protein methyltransferase [Archaeoglobaceae archaeon]